MRVFYRSISLTFVLYIIVFSRINAQFEEPKLWMADRVATDWFDVDMDGDKDMVDRINGIWTEQDVNGNFYIQHIITTDAIELMHDMDLDGDVDALGHGPNNVIRWFENNNDGAFWIAHDLGSWDGYHTFFDVDLDGQEDLLNMAASGECFVHYFLGPGLFGSAAEFPYPNPTLFFYELNYNNTLYTDLDGDGFKDIFSNFCDVQGCINGSYNRFQFSSEGYIEVIDQNYATMVPVFSGDFDSDGDNEPLMFGINSGNVYVLNNAGNGDITSATSLMDLEDIGQPIRLADLNGDGLNDVLFTDNVFQLEQVSFGMGAGSFSAPEILFGANYNTDMNSYFNIADIDGDLDLDISNVSLIFLNDGTGHFDSPVDMVSIFGLASSFGNYDSDENYELVVLPNGIIHFNGNGQMEDETVLSFSNLTSEDFSHLSKTFS